MHSYYKLKCNKDQAATQSPAISPFPFFYPAFSLQVWNPVAAEAEQGETC